MLLGTYEQACVPWSPRETPWDFGSQLLKPDLDRITPELSVAFKHYPAMAHDRHPPGRQRAVHVLARRQPARRPDPRAARLLGRLRRDGRAVAGRRRRARAGHLDDRGRPRRFRAWISGRMDVARYGDYATLAYTNAKVQENYRRRFRITFPNEELPAARPLLTTPIRDRLTAANAVWGATFGLEHALWFQAAGLRAGRGGDVPALERLGPGRGRGRGGPRAGRDDRDLELRQVPGHGTGRRGLAVVAADGPDAGARPDHADRDAQRGGPDRRRVHRRAGRPPPTSSTCSDRCRPRSITRAGSATTCRPTAPFGSRCSGWG